MVIELTPTESRTSLLVGVAVVVVVVVEMGALRVRLGVLPKIRFNILFGVFFKRRLVDRKGVRVVDGCSMTM